MFTIPMEYQNRIGEQFMSNAEEFVKNLSQKQYSEIEENIYDFCIKNKAVATFEYGEHKKTFGDKEKLNAKKQTESLTYQIEYENMKESAILILIPIESASAEIQEVFMKKVPWILFGVFILSLICALFVHFSLVKPITYLSNISKKMARLDLRWTCSLKRKDEIGVLAESLNEMSENLKNTFSELEIANEKLKNEIVQVKRLQKEKKNFFMAASHELKTPIAVLKGQIESMLYNIGDYRDRDTYLKDSLDVLNRMEELVREILLSVKTEYQDSSYEFEKFDLCLVIEGKISEVQMLAKQKKIYIYNLMPQHFVINANKNLFSKVLANIIGNAIEYSPQNSEVIIYIKKDNILSITNTNAYINPHDLESIFEPFYRVEKSMNRNTGGSGLGLYIVKNILNLHGIKYNMENTERGVEFQMYLSEI